MLEKNKQLTKQMPYISSFLAQKIFYQQVKAKLIRYFLKLLE